MTGLDFPLWLRTFHFLNIVFLSLIMRSGIEILSAHPKLYWHDNTVPDSEWIKFTKRKRPKKGLWTSRDQEEAFSSWIALPGHENLGLGRHWHFLTDTLWVISGVTYVILLFATNEWQRIVPTSWSVFTDAWNAFGEYITLHIVISPKYNGLQMLAYFSVVFILAPLAILTGLTMSPAIVGRFPWYLRIFGGRQKARSFHFIILGLFLLFTIVHTVMVILHGFAQELGAIVLGQTQNVNRGLALGVGLGGLVLLFVIHIVITRYSLAHPRTVKNWMDAPLTFVRRLLFHHEPSKQNYAPSQISPDFIVNGRPPEEAEYAALAKDNFANFVLEIGGLVEKPLHLRLADLQMMPKTSQITLHHCIEGWSSIGQWGGVQLNHIIKLCRPKPEVRYIVFYAFDNKTTSEPHPAGPGYFYGTLDLELANHSQTILAYEFNGEPLPLPHGAPIRLRVENQLGFKMVKYIRAIEFVTEYKSIGEGQGGWREDHQHYSTEAGI